MKRNKITQTATKQNIQNYNGKVGDLENLFATGIPVQNNTIIVMISVLLVLTSPFTLRVRKLFENICYKKKAQLGLNRRWKLFSFPISWPSGEG